MPFSVTQKTLERLEWSEVLARLGAHLRTPGARARLAPAEGEAFSTALFEPTEARVRERLAETAEAVALRAGGEHPPIGEIGELTQALARARKGGTLGPREILDVASAVATVRATRTFLLPRAEAAPRLSDLAATLSDAKAFESEVARCLDSSGEVKDEASDALALARRTARELASEITARIDRILRNPDIAGALSDNYFTVRNDRYVLPVRADAKGQVRGIVHDASGSGTTLYVEPEALVDPNNRHKQAEIDADREVARVLQRLSAQVASLADALEADLETLAWIDLAFGRAALADEMDAVAPEVGRDGIVVLPQLRHPAIARSEAVPNDLRLGESFHVLVISGPNAGGKTVAMKALALAALFVRAGLHVPAAPGARIDLFDALLADIGDEQSIGESLSTFSAHMANLARIVDAAGPHSLVVLDEIGVGTDPGEGAAIAQAILEALADARARVVATTHYGLLKEMADTDPRFENASVEFDPETLAPTYRLRMGFPGSSSATAVAARMGLRQEVLDRAHQFLEREDRQLDRLLSELSTSRAALEQEQRVASELRKQTEGARDEYRKKLASLQERRDKLYRALRDDLDKSFQDARAQIAAVIRDLQRGGRAQDAARARERLEAIREKASQAEAQAGVSREQATLAPMDWQHAHAGDAVRIAGGGSGVLQALPDKRGRVVVSVGGTRITVAAERVGPDPAGPARPVSAKRPPSLPAPEPGEGDEDSGRCDLRGLRVDEALDQLLSALDRATAASRPRLLVVHGLGTGALRKAVRETLASSRYVKDVEPAAANQGGDGATIAILS